MKRDDRVYLEHIVESFSKVVDYIHKVNYEEFLQNEEKQDAVIRKIEVAGEATKQISQELRNKYSSIPWRAMAGMRDKLIHNYFNVDLETVWETATNDIPRLLSLLKEIQEDIA